ncbi:site-specific integrase, partial [Chloroflexota bacterium]
MKEDINRFLTYLSVEKGFSDNTLDAYKNDLSQLAIFIEE